MNRLRCWLNYSRAQWHAARDALSRANKGHGSRADAMRSLAHWRNEILNTCITLRQMLPPRTDR